MNREDAFRLVKEYTQGESLISVEAVYSGSHYPPLHGERNHELR